MSNLKQIKIFIHSLEWIFFLSKNCSYILICHYLNIDKEIAYPVKQKIMLTWFQFKYVKYALPKRLPKTLTLIKPSSALYLNVTSKVTFYIFFQNESKIRYIKSKGSVPYNRNKKNYDVHHSSSTNYTCWTVLFEAKVLVTIHQTDVLTFRDNIANRNSKFKYFLEHFTCGNSFKLVSLKLKRNTAVWLEVICKCKNIL